MFKHNQFQLFTMDRDVLKCVFDIMCFHVLAKVVSFSGKRKKIPSRKIKDVGYFSGL